MSWIYNKWHIILIIFIYSSSFMFFRYQLHSSFFSFPSANAAISDGEGRRERSATSTTILSDDVDGHITKTIKNNITSSSLYQKRYYTKHLYDPVLHYARGKDTPLPIVNDPHLKVEVVAQGLEFPTTMAFLDKDDILVLEKDNGTVRKVVDGKVLSQPLLDVNVATAVERCMCGIAIPKSEDQSNSNKFVFLYYTEAANKDGGPAIGNRLYRYELDNDDNKLVSPKLFLDLPALPGPRHNGGAIIIGPKDNNIYIPIGDVDGHKSQSENIKNGLPPDGTGGILEIRQDGQPVTNLPLVDDEKNNNSHNITSSNMIKYYYAYGIRNSFGLDFDPVTGKLWDTENGPGFGDEINLVYPGFNSGWRTIQGIWMRESNNSMGAEAPSASVLQQQSDRGSRGAGLVDFDGRGKYSPPEFTWNNTVGPTKIKFLNTGKLGEQYENDIFVGDVHKGNIYHFKLNSDRTQLVLSGPLADKVANTDKELQSIIFGTGFGGISDLEVGPDGYLYVVSLGQGKIFKISPK